MEEGGRPQIQPFPEITAAVRTLSRAPFFTILLLELLLGVVSASISDLIGPNPTEELEYLITAATIFFGTASIYLQIATTLAAGGNGEGSAEVWIRAALRHRCFWRYLGASILAILLILLGMVALVIGGFVVASALALTQASVILERTGPVEGLRRSAELSSPARKAVGIIFAVFWLPALAAAAAFIVWDVDLGFVAQFLVDAGGSILAVAANIALTRVFVKLGGAPTPPVQTLLYKAGAGSPP